MQTEISNDSKDNGTPSQIPTLSADALFHYLRFAQALSIEVGDLLREGYYRSREIARKSERELVTSVDIAAEKLIHARINAEFPEHDILSEELGTNQDMNVPELWVVDPLDGTNNFAHGFPVFAVSLAFVHNGAMQVGVVHDPMRQEIFAATAIDKAYMNGEQILVSDTKELSAALLATGFPYDRAGAENNLDHFANFWYASQGIRRAGSAALDLCYVAAGRLDGFWELKLKPWDMAAGALIAQRAGAIVTNFAGAPWTLRNDRIIAANPNIHGQMLDIIKGQIGFAK